MLKNTLKWEMGLSARQKSTQKTKEAVLKLQFLGGKRGLSSFLELLEKPGFWPAFLRACFKANWVLKQTQGTLGFPGNKASVNHVLSHTVR
jgi:hypothetical protein